MKKRIVSLILLGTMVMTAFAGCGKKNVDVDVDTDDTIDVLDETNISADLLKEKAIAYFNSVDEADSVEVSVYGGYNAIENNALRYSVGYDNTSNKSHLNLSPYGVPEVWIDDNTAYYQKDDEWFQSELSAESQVSAGVAEIYAADSIEESKHIFEDTDSIEYGGTTIIGDQMYYVLSVERAVNIDEPFSEDVSENDINVNEEISESADAEVKTEAENIDSNIDTEDADALKNEAANIDTEDFVEDTASENEIISSSLTLPDGTAITIYLGEPVTIDDVEYVLDIDGKIYADGKTYEYKESDTSKKTIIYSLYFDKDLNVFAYAINDESNVKYVSISINSFKFLEPKKLQDGNYDAFLNDFMINYYIDQESQVEEETDSEISDETLEAGDE